MMNQLLIASAATAMAAALTPAAAQMAPPPGVAQGTIAPWVQPSAHAPPVILTRRAVTGSLQGEAMTRDLMLEHVRQMFAIADADHDGFVTKGEIQAFDESRMHEAHISERFADDGLEGQSGETARMAGRAALFSRLDANHDGVISRQEFMAARPSVRERRVVVMRERRGVKTADIGPMGDMEGVGMPMPFANLREMGMHGRFAAHLLATADINHDGRVSLAEAEAAALAHFDRVDLNHDGMITPDERHQAHERRTGSLHPR